MACCTGLNPTSLPNGKVGTSYSQTITGVCPDIFYSITLASGTVPPGLVFTGGSNISPASLSGTPTASGSFTFTVQLTSAGCPDITQQYTITIRRRNAGGGVVAGAPVASQDIYFNIVEFNAYMNSVIQNGFPLNSPLTFDINNLQGVPSEILYYGVYYQYAGVVANTYRFTKASNQRRRAGIGNLQEN